MGLESLPEPLVRAWTARTVARDLAPWKELWGPHVPEDFGRVREKVDGGFLVDSPDEALAAPNAFEHFVVAAQSASPIVLRQAFCGVWFLADIPSEGDCIMAHFHSGSDLAQVVRLDHETGFFYGPIAADIPTFDAIADLEARARAGERIDGVTAFEPLVSRFTDRWPLSLYLDAIAPAVTPNAKDGEALARWLVEKVRYQGLELASNLLMFQERSDWIVSALAEGRVGAVPEAQLTFTPDAALGNPRFANLPPTVLYWLWRSYLLGEDEFLDRIVAAAQPSSAKLVRDAVALVEQARSGKLPRLGTVPLSELRAKLQALVARMRDPFPPRFEIGPISFERRDELAAGLELATPPAVALPDPSPDADPRWGGEIAVPHPDGRWILTHGTRRHPRAGRHPSIPRHEAVLVEVAPETGEARVFALAPDQVCDAWYVTPDLVAVHDGGSLCLYERHGERAWLTESMRLPQRRLWRSRDGRTIVATGGLRLYTGTGYAWTPERVDVVRIDGRHLVSIGSALVPLSIGATRDGVLVLADEERGVAYSAEGVDRVAELDADRSCVVVRPTCFAASKTDVRVGPNAVLDALGAMDISVDTAGNAYLVLRGKPGNVFDVMGGDATGLFSLEPPVAGGDLYWDVLSADRALVTTAGAVHVVDLAARSTRRVVELGEDTSLVVKTDDGCARIEGETLVLHGAASQGSWPVLRRVLVGPGAAIDCCYLDGRILAVTREDCPLILLAVRGSELWLLGAADPTSAVANAEIVSVAAPNGFWRLLAKADGRPVLEAHALERAWAHAVATRPPDVGDAVGAQPWTKRPIRCR